MTFIKLTEISEILSRIALNIPISSEESGLLNSWIDESPRNKLFYENIKDGKVILRDIVEAEKYSPQEAAKSINNIISRNKRRRIVAWASSVSAAAVAVVAVLLFQNWGDSPVNDLSTIARADNMPILELSDGSRYVMWQSGAQLVEKDGTQLLLENNEVFYLNNDVAGTELIYNRLIVPRGSEVQRVTFADGSTVWLNLDSRLEYPLSFTGDERRVRLVGEAFFDVVKDDNKPFIVESGSQSAIVLGTQFNVSTYPDENTVTTLVSGSVKVQIAHLHEEAILRPGQQSRFDPDSGNFAIRNVNARNFASWKDGEISFDGISFEQILAKISRIFDVEFDLAGNSDIADMKFIGGMYADETFETMLSTLSKAGNVQFQLNKYGKIKVEKN
ncbi:MAG: FecR domain-containing protein [Rikenellaceae bacterium]|nr:FecR domain-containing protein [Rikenellaceae bacterium]MCL2692756.1 FecR domain-containing protein [Rikenellaceae bacterium]